MRILLALLLATMASYALSTYDTLTTKSGRTFESVRVTKEEPDGIRITHAEGAGKILFTDLPEEILAFYNYDPAAATAHQQELRATQQRIAAERQAQQQNQKINDLLEAQAIQFTAEIFQIIEGGLLAKKAFANEEVEVQREKLVSKGLILKPEEKTLVQWSEKVTQQRPLSPDDDQLIFIECNPSGLVDSQSIGGHLWRIGTFTYESRLGTTKTVPKYTNNPETARRYLAGNF